MTMKMYDTPAERLLVLLRDGPDAGLHVMAWCDAIPNLVRAVGHGIREFGSRIAGPMSNSESTEFLDDAAASRIDRPLPH